MPVEIETIILGPLETNCYVLRIDGRCAIVDPGWGGEALLRPLRDHSCQPEAVWLTHGHGDHIAGTADLKKAFCDARICCPADDRNMLSDAAANMSAAFGLAITSPPADELIRPGQTLTLADSRWDVLDTSGHTRGGVSYYCASAGTVLTGDALFKGGIGRTDIPDGSAGRLLKNIRNNLMTLPDETVVLPGHGAGSTIGAERRQNPFLIG